MLGICDADNLFHSTPHLQRHLPEDKAIMICRRVLTLSLTGCPLLKLASTGAEGGVSACDIAALSVCSVGDVMLCLKCLCLCSLHLCSFESVCPDGQKDAANLSVMTDKTDQGVLVSIACVHDPS